MTPTSARARKSFDSGRLYRLACKELIEILRDRRTIVTLVLMPLIVYPLMGMVVQKLVLQSLTGSSEIVYNLGFETEDDARGFSNLFAAGQRKLDAVNVVDRTAAQPDPGDSQAEQIRRSLQEKLDSQAKPEVRYFFSEGMPLKPLVQSREIDLAIRPRTDADGPGYQLIYNPQDNFSLQALRYVQKRIRYANEAYSEDIVRTSNTRLPAPVSLRETPVASASQQPILLTFVPLMLVLMTITGAVYPAIDLTAGERERGTMEILVAAPVSRLLVLCGKFFAVLTVAILTAIANLVAMTVTVYALGLDKLIFGDAIFSVFTVLTILVLLVVLAAFFSATLLCLTSFARSFKEAQAYLIPLMLVAFAPGLLSLTPNLENGALLSVIPLVNIVLSGKDLLAGSANPMYVAIAICSTAIYGLAALSLAARIFGMDSILTGGRSTWSDLLTGTKEQKPTPDVQTAFLFLAVLFPAFIVFAGVSSNIAAKLELTVTARLSVNAGITALLFLGLPYFFATISRFATRTTFFLVRPSMTAWIAAVLLGSSVWVLAYELEITTLSQDRIDRFVELFESMKVELSQIPLAVKLICLALVPAVCEEFTFRGFLLSALHRRIPGVAAVIVTALLFGLFHVFVRDSLMFERMLPSSCMGLLLGWVCLRTGSIYPGMLLHAVHNGLLIALSHYEKQLTDFGFGIDEQQHLPQSLILLALIPIVLGMVILLLKRSEPAARVPAAWSSK